MFNRVCDNYSQMAACFNIYVINRCKSGRLVFVIGLLSGNMLGFATYRSMTKEGTVIAGCA